MWFHGSPAWWKASAPALGQVVKKGTGFGGAIASPTASEQRSELQTAHKRLALAKTTYEREKNGFIAQPVKLGRSDGKRIEVLGGLKAGMPYASTGSFVIKAELGKASAEHTH
jgi:hypothetical protein